MNWSEEEYVRIYKRNTVEIASWGWQARAVFWELMRLSDEDGNVPCQSIGGLCALLMIPADVVEPALAMLCGGPMERLEAGFLIRNYLVAQRAPRQDAARKREERKRRANDLLVQDNGGQLRTSLDNVTPRSRSVSDPAPSPIRPDLGSLSENPTVAPAGAPVAEAPRKERKKPGTPPGLVRLIAVQRELGGDAIEDKNLGTAYAAVRGRGDDALEAIVRRAWRDNPAFGAIKSLAWLLRNLDRFSTQATTKRGSLSAENQAALDEALRRLDGADIKATEVKREVKREP